MSIENFNDRQKEAVIANEKNILVIAGAGSGKTSVLTGRIARIVKEGAPTNTIFAVTFTNKAAGEMKERIYQKIDSPMRDIQVGTFHSLFGKILKDNWPQTVLRKDYQVIDSDEQKMLIKNIILDLNLLAEYGKKELRTALSKAINESLKYIGTQKDFCRRAKDSEWSDYEDQVSILNCLEVYKEYELRMLSFNLIDFGDLLLYPYEILTANKRLLNELQDFFTNVLVDEFQDTNFIQYELVKMLSKKCNLFIVGDDDQSIYGWRGAEIQNILGFEDSMNARVIKLEQNYRSVTNVLDAANSVISNNKDRVGKNLWSDKETGSKIIKNEFFYESEEADFIAAEIKKLINKGVEPTEIAIIYRNNAISRPLEKALNKLRIDYVIIGGLSFWKRAEIKDIISMVSLIENDLNVFAFIRSMGQLTKGIGDKSIDKIVGYAFKNKISILDAVSVFIESSNEKSAEKRLSKAQTAELIKFDLIYKQAKDIYKDINNLSDVLVHFISTDFVENYQIKDTEECYTDRIDNLASIVDFASEIQRQTDDDENKIETLSDFVNFAMLQSSADEKSVDKSVQLMTIHSSKGLEFEYVFLNCLNDNVIPSPSAVLEGRIDEERRLFYVAITRAKKGLYLTYYESMYGNTTKPSKFINEIPKELIEQVSQNKRSNDYYNSSKQKNTYLQKLRKGQAFEHPEFGKGFINDYKVIGDYISISADFHSIGSTVFTIHTSELIGWLDLKQLFYLIVF